MPSRKSRGRSKKYSRSTRRTVQKIKPRHTRKKKYSKWKKMAPVKAKGILYPGYITIKDILERAQKNYNKGNRIIYRKFNLRLQMSWMVLY